VYKLIRNVVKNAVRAQLSESTWFDPVFSTLYVTPLCNLRCGYCEDFGVHRNAGYKTQLMSLDRYRQILDILGAETQVLYVTGGEPTMNDDLLAILRHARTAGFGYIAMNTNALTLHDHADVLDELDHLVISVDSVDVGRWDDTLATQPKNIERLLANVRWAAGEQKRRAFQLTITSVVTPGRVSAARAVRDFAFSIGAEFSAQHLSVHRIPSAELSADPDFHAFMRELLEQKRAGKGVSGSHWYLEAIDDRADKPSFACTPTAAPHVDWRGMLAFPCRELPDHVLVDLVAAGSYRAALDEGARRFGGPPPGDCHRCGERCYVELSTLTRHPPAAIREGAHYLKRTLTSGARSRDH
jgi:MoaA/NifB/PqqE/SkfB family radical SAM enzyme